MERESCNNCINKAGTCRIRGNPTDAPCDHYRRIATERKCRWCGANTPVRPDVKKVLCKHCFKSIANAYEHTEKVLDGAEPNCLVM